MLQFPLCEIPKHVYILTYEIENQLYFEGNHLKAAKRTFYIP